ncbi:MAG: hypothetical protein ACTHJT_00010, partial [Cytophaga sp.]|uniref:hypothetical protein n=1 Tax=Cytophaga sp. TaxID=29535 RepID=UPI003F81E6ED
MKNAQRLIRSLLLVLVSMLVYSNTNAQILVSGTDFDPLPGNASRFYIGLTDISQIGFQPGSIVSTPPLAPNVNTNNFNVGYFYAITPTPIRLDSTRYQDFTPTTDYSYVYSPTATSPGSNVNILSYSLTNLVPNSAVSVIVDYCSAVKSTYASCTGQRNEFKAGINLDQYNLLNGTDAPQIGMGQCQSATFTGTVDASGNMVFRMNDTKFGSCQAMAIKKIQIMGFPQPKIIANEGTEVCAGEQVTLQTTTEYNATYQWQVNTGSGWTNISGATNQAVLYDVPTVQAYQFRAQITPKPSGTAITSNVVTVNAITCCVEGGVPTSRKTIYYDDFGTVDLTDVTGKTYKVWDYSNVLNPTLVTKTTTTPFRWQLTPAPLGATFQATGPLQDGQYTVAGYLTGYNPDNGYQGAMLQWANRIGGPNPPPEVSLDHSGTKAGACLLINCPTGTFGQKLYTRTISNLCFGKQLSFECWINVFTDGPGSGCSYYAPVNVQIKLTDGSNAANSVTASATATRQADGGGVWVRVSGNITLGAGSTSVIMDVINNSTESTCGNDLVLDDIKIMACSPPPLNVYFDIPTLATTKNVCTASLDLDVKPSALLNSYYSNNAQYLYQWTKTPNDYTSWKNLAAPQAGQTYTIPNPSLNAAYAGTVDGDKIYFRVVATTPAVFAANNNFTAPKYANDNDPCKNYSVSDPIESTVQCPKCSKPTAVTITVPAATPTTICQGTAQTLTGSATVTAASLNGGFTYSWIKTLPAPSTVKVTPTTVTIPANTATPMPSYTGITGALADAGTYVLRVEDGNTGNSSCYTEATVVINVSPT